jgi:LruC domain-containing protein
MKQLFTYVFLFFVATLVSCKKDNSNNVDPEVENLNKVAPDGFNYSTTKNVKLDLTLRANNDQALSGVVVSVYDPSNTATDAAIFKGVTDKNGNLSATVSVAAYLNKLVIDPAYIGLMRNAQVTINNNAVNAVIGGVNGYGGDVLPETFETTSIAAAKSKVQTNGIYGTEYDYLGDYTASTAFVSPTNLGRPKYIEANADVISASLLSYINASLPEGKNVAEVHPEYLNSSAVSTINVTAKSDVYITFVSEGADYKNTLAYYTYPTNNPPKYSSGSSLFNAIDKITYVFPNASAVGSSGGLKSGDKVKIGQFEAGTSVAFVLIQNAWTGSSVTSGNQKFFSNSAFNPEDNGKTRHSVMLWDNVHKLYVIGFEDCNRDNKYTNPGNYPSDDDFNDVVVYATSNPVTGVSNNGVSEIDNGGDADADGVLDELDAFPNDASKAYVSYYPSASTYSTVAFEDNWPKKGDYDLNDLVVKTRYTFYKNAKNEVVELKGDYSVAASGASFKNGFGVQFPFAASAVQSVSGYKHISGYISLANNGVEAGQTNAVIIPFDNHEAVIHNHDYSYLINTLDSKVKVISDVASVTVKFVSPMSAASLGTAPFNPFLISNLRRGYEIHLPGYLPTDKINKALYKTEDDATTPTSNKYFVSKENWPWAISYNEQFDYPFEEVNITQAYPHFIDWANSGGTSYTDWYKTTTAGYRNTTKIYNK